MRGAARIAIGAALAWTALPPATALGWGFLAHRLINEQAIETLPDPLRGYFRAHRSELSDRSVEPDTVLRARYGRREAVRHFIDLDLYGDPPFSALPRSYRAAVRKFGRETVRERGTLPWTILRRHARLAREMRAGEWQKALATAGLAGHYVADAFMPLHTTDNHDGQKTRQRGIHAAIEKNLVDARLATYRARLRGRAGPASVERFTEAGVFQMLLDSYSQVDPLLRADRRARRLGSVDSPAYLDALDESAGNVLATQLARAAEALGSFWLSAWEEAGRPRPPGNHLDSIWVSPYHPHHA